MAEDSVQLASVNDTALEYEDSGTGEPIVFIHGALIADTFRLLVAQRSLAARHRLISYHRQGYVESSGVSGRITVARQAADCLSVLQHLGLESAHVVGHSYGGCIALQLALDVPEVVRSLVLLEPALILGSTAQSYRESLAHASARHQDEPAEILVDEFLQARWPGYRGALDKILPGAFAQAVADAETAFETDLPGLLEWSFGEDEVRQISQPVLSVLGAKSDALWPRFGEIHELLLAWLPHAEGVIVPNSTHFLPLENSRTMAEVLASFLARRLAS